MWIKPPTATRLDAAKRTGARSLSARCNLERRASVARDVSHDPQRPADVRSIALLSDADQRWRAFASERATSPLQSPAWLDALTGAYRLHARIMALVDPRGAVLAGMPMIRSKLRWRRRWTSLPFTDTLEPLAVDMAHRDALLVAAAQDADAAPIVVRTHAALPGWFSREVGTVQVLDVSGGCEGVLRGASANHRRSVNRARRQTADLTAKPISARSEFLGANLALLARSRRRLGAPTQPSRYWRRLWEMHERDQALTIGVYLGEKLVANGVFIIGRRHAVYKYGAADVASRHLRTSFLMFATAFDCFASRGIRSLDFGITDLHNASLREFKTRWGGEERSAHFSATDARMLPPTLEPGRLLTKTIQRAPTFVGRSVGSLAYPFAA